MSTVCRIINSIQPSDAGNDAGRQQILQEFADHVRQPHIQQQIDILDRQFRASNQTNNLNQKYSEVLNGIDDSNKLEGDHKTLKQNLVDAIIKLHPHLNSRDPNKYVNVCKACKDRVDGPQNRHEVTAPIHGAWGSRSTLMGNDIGDKVVYFRTSELEQFELIEIEIQLYTSEYGALLHETLLTVVNMIWNEDGCINRNMLALSGRCKQRINSVCILVIDMRKVRQLHDQQGGLCPVLNADWYQRVVDNMTTQHPWLRRRPRSHFHYESRIEYDARVAGTHPSVHPPASAPGGRTRRSSDSASRSARTHAHVDEEENTNASESDDTPTAIIEQGIRVTEGRQLYSHLRHKRLWTIEESGFRSFSLCRSTITRPSPRQFQFDDCLVHIDLALVQHYICGAKTFSDLVNVMMDIVNRPDILLGEIKLFELSEFTQGGELYTPLLELSINVNYTNVGENEIKATFFQRAWDAHEYKQKYSLHDGRCVTVIKQARSAVTLALENWEI